MRVIPVIDLMSGLAVRGIAGQRSRYQPVVSILAKDATPGSIAQAFVQQLGEREVYVADLDAIAGREPNWDAFQQIVAAGLRPWVDAGLGEPARGRQLADWAATCPSLAGLVVGLESVAEPAGLPAIQRTVALPRCVFSLDLRDGKPLVAAKTQRVSYLDWTARVTSRVVARLSTRIATRFSRRFGGRRSWQGWTARQIADFAVQTGFQRLLVLDLAAVGTGCGPAAEPLCRELRKAYPAIDLLTGGGVRGCEDLRRLADCGCDGALVASALHDGRLSPAEIRDLEQT